MKVKSHVLNKGLQRAGPLVNLRLVVQPVSPQAGRAGLVGRAWVGIG